MRIPCNFQKRRLLQKHAQLAISPEIPVVFNLASTDQHCHIPLLLCHHGYSSYRSNWAQTAVSHTESNQR